MNTPAKPVRADIAEILQRKADARKANAALSFGEKIRRLEELRERLAPINRAREAREVRQYEDG